MSKFAFGPQTVYIAYLPLRQDFLEKNVLMTAQRDYGLGNSLLRCDPNSSPFLSCQKFTPLIPGCCARNATIIRDAGGAPRASPPHFLSAGFVADWRVC
jgi:hypothetical protein